MSNTSATCNGHNLNATFGEAHGTDNGCGNTQISGVPKVADPYAGLASNIPPNTCGGSYPQEPAKKKDPALPAANQWSRQLHRFPASKSSAATSSSPAIRPSTTAVLVIENGQLDTTAILHVRLRADGGLRGSNNASYTHAPTGGGTLDIAAPTSGAWSGVAIYQDPSLTTNVNISVRRKQPDLEPQRSRLSAALRAPPSAAPSTSRATDRRCFTMVVDNITINGTGSIFARRHSVPGRRPRTAAWRRSGKARQLKRRPMVTQRRALPLRPGFGPDDRGTAATEFAAVAMLLVMILGNAVDFGVYQYRSMQVQEAAQVGAQTAWSVFYSSPPACNAPASFPRPKTVSD